MEKTVYSGNYIKVTEEQIDQNNWERCYLRDGVIVFAQKDNGKFIMINVTSGPGLMMALRCKRAIMTYNEFII